MRDSVAVPAPSQLVRCGALRRQASSILHSSREPILEKVLAARGPGQESRKTKRFRKASQLQPLFNLPLRSHSLTSTSDQSGRYTLRRKMALSARTLVLVAVVLLVLLPAQADAFGAGSMRTDLVPNV